MLCHACEHENEGGSRFCESCGAGLSPSCGRCGEVLSASARFCRSCGAPVAEEGPAPRSAPAAATPEPPAIAHPGERRLLTAMFCDLVDSTPLAQRVDPEELREVVSLYQDVCSRAVKRYGGHIAQYLGDGVLVYFGYPLAHEDDAERAVRAGLAIQEELAALNDRRARARLLEIPARVGIHTGPVVVSEMGDEAHRETLALGDTINLASRLEALAAPGEVVMSADTLRLVTGVFVTQDLGSPDLKGFQEPVGVHRVLREAGVGDRALAQRKLTPLAGRDHQLEQLLDRWGQVQEGFGQVVVISGDAGIGKSRLVHAFRERIAGASHSWLELNCSHYTSGSAFQPCISLFELGLGFEAEDTPEAKLAKLEERLAAVPNLELDGIVPYVGSLLALPQSERFPLRDMGPEVRREKTIQALMAPILAIATEQPIVVSCEDLHWSDPSTLDLLGRLIDQVPTVRLMLIATFRSNFEPPWRQTRTYISPISLARLSRRQTTDMIDRAVGAGRLPRSVLEQIVERADGVPLFAEELARSVIESRMLIEREGHYELQGRIDDLKIPTTLQGSLMARLDRLSAAKRVAQIGATLGREFHYSLAEAVAEVDVPDLRRGLDQLVDAEILFQRGTPPEASYTFKHALLQDTAYESQLKSRRRELHARTATALEERFPQRVTAEPELMARHCAKGELVPQAIHYYQQAADQAVARIANAEAIEYFSRALDLLATLPEDDARRQQEIALRLSLAGPFTAQRGYEDDVLASAHRIEELCEQLGSGPQQIPGLIGLAVYHQMRGDLGRAALHAGALLEIAEPLGIPVLVAAARVILGSTAMTRTTVPEARAHLEKAIAVASDAELPVPSAAHDQDVLAMAHTSYAIALALSGDPEGSLSEIEIGIARARSLDHSFTLASNLSTGTWALYFLAEAERALSASEECLRLIDGLGFHASESSALVQRGWARAALGDPGGIADVQDGLDLCESSGSLAGLGQLYLLGADACQAAGRFELSAPILARVAPIMERSGEGQGYGSQLLTLHAIQALRGGGSRDDAESLLLEALEWNRDFLSPNVALRPTLLLTRMAIEKGKAAEARARLEEVYACFTNGYLSPRLREAAELIDQIA